MSIIQGIVIPVLLVLFLLAIAFWTNVRFVQSVIRMTRKDEIMNKDLPLRPMHTAPKDGTTITIRLIGAVRVYWDDELDTWVLCHPLHLESIREPIGWLSADNERSKS